MSWGRPKQLNKNPLSASDNLGLSRQQLELHRYPGRVDLKFVLFFELERIYPTTTAFSSSLLFARIQILFRFVSSQRFSVL